MGFIAYRRQATASPDVVVRIYMECQEASSAIHCSSAVDVIFPNGRGPCRLSGVDTILCLKKFYKLVFSLEERAREHHNDWRVVTESPERLLEHLGYTRNARDLTGQAEPRLCAAAEVVARPDCAQFTGTK